jgi:hypothetical protein
MTRRLLLTLWFAFSSAGLHAQVEPIEGAIESRSVELLIDQKGLGTVIFQDCGDCPKLRLDATSQAFLNGEPITMAKARVHARKGATVIYDLETNVVTRIRM